MMASIGAASQACAATSEVAQLVPRSIVDQSSVTWETLKELCAGSWIVYDSKPFFYYRFHEINSKSIKYVGLDSDGNVVAGNFIHDLSSGSVSHFSIRKGVVSEHIVAKQGASLLFLGTEGGAQVGQRLTAEGFGQFRIDYTEFRRGTWLVVRSARYRSVSDDEIEALGWIKRNPEFEAQAEAERQVAMASNPSFGRRLIAALEDGVVEGVRGGVDERVRKTIGGK